VSAVLEDETKRWSTRRKTALILKIILAETSRTHSMHPSEI
jgi:hypothetical protein